MRWPLITFFQCICMDDLSFDSTIFPGRTQTLPVIRWSVSHLQSKFDNSKRKGPQEIFRMIESSNFRES